MAHELDMPTTLTPNEWHRRWEEIRERALRAHARRLTEAGRKGCQG